MDYYFKGKELLVNELSFHSQTYCENYNFYNFVPVNIQGTCGAYAIDSEKIYSKNLMIKDLPTKSITSFYFNLYLEKEEDIVFLFHISSAAKLWVNGEIMVSDEDTVQGMYVKKLKKGKNVISGEFFAEEKKSVSFVCRISGLETENKREYDNITESRNVLTAGLVKPLNMWDQKTFFNNEEYSDCIFIRDFNKYDFSTPISMRIFYRNNLEAIDEINVYFNKKYTLKFSEYRKNLPDGLYDIVAEYNIPKKDGTEEKIYKSFLIKDFIDETEKYIIRKNSIPKDKIEELKDFPCSFYLEYLETAEDKNILGKRFDIFSDRVKRHYFKSKLDGKSEKFHIRIPFGYDNNKKYPLLLCVSTVRTSDFSYLIDYKNVLIADISGKGVTGGSYIGETSVLEGLEEIKRRYNVDERKIYLFGFSNGAYASANLLLHYPHIFAGVYLLAGKGDNSLVKNIENKAYFNIYSSYDGAGSVPCLISKSDKNTIVSDCPILNHNLLLYYFGQEKILNKLFSFECEKYPDEIHVKTYTMRHRRYYWFEFLNISFAEKFAKADISVKHNIMNISVEGCDRFLINVPPKLSDKEVKIYVNNSFIGTVWGKVKKFYIEKTNDSFIFSDEFSPKDTSKGTGLLDVYYDPLKIYIPNENLKNTAEKFARPQTNGYISEVFTDYPIISSEEFDENKNAIIFDCMSGNSNVLNEIRNSLPLVPMSDGFIYRGTKFKGKYSVMQIIPNLKNAEIKILHISTNDISYLNKNMFLRKVIIPFDANGRNPYWNNEALIFYNNKYYTIYENKGEMKAYF